MSNLINYLQHTNALINGADEYKPSNLIPFHTVQKLQSPTEVMGVGGESCFTQPAAANRTNQKGRTVKR